MTPRLRAPPAHHCQAQSPALDSIEAALALQEKLLEAPGEDWAAPGGGQSWRLTHGLLSHDGAEGHLLASESPVVHRAGPQGWLASPASTVGRVVAALVRQTPSQLGCVWTKLLFLRGVSKPSALDDSLMKCFAKQTKTLQITWINASKLTFWDCPIDVRCVG